jgi:hypothetical protein
MLVVLVPVPVVVVVEAVAVVAVVAELLLQLLRTFQLDIVLRMHQ